jgi:hypothetical protein
MENTIPILSLLIALLAVFIGPMLSARSAKNAMLGPMRQEWINNLRSLLAEIASSCLHYYQSGYEDRTEEEYRRIKDIEHKILFMINPNEIEHQNLVKIIRKMAESLDRGKQGDDDFIASYKELLSEGRNVLKKEWNVVKNKKSHY